MNNTLRDLAKQKMQDLKLEPLTPLDITRICMSLEYHATWLQESSHPDELKKIDKNTYSQRRLAIREFRMARAFLEKASKRRI